MQAGLTQKRLTFRDVFGFIPIFLRLARNALTFISQRNSIGGVHSAILFTA
jgi:hypothetical protein